MSGQGTVVDLSQLTAVQAQRVAALLGMDPSSVPVRCEAPGCQQVHPLSEMHSVAAIWRHTRGVDPFQCADEQHWGCTPEHAAAAMIQCLNGHILPALANRVAERDRIEQEQQQAQETQP